MEIKKRNEETNRLIVYFSDQPAGQVLSYKQIEEESGVRMNYAGKQMMRSALNHLKIEYYVQRGQGIQLANAENTSLIMVGKLSKVDNSIKRASKSHKRLMKFTEELPEEEKKSMLFLGGMFGVMRAYTIQARKYTKIQQQNTEQKPIMLPGNIAKQFEQREIK